MSALLEHLVKVSTKTDNISEVRKAYPRKKKLALVSPHPDVCINLYLSCKRPFLSLCDRVVLPKTMM